MNRIQRDSGSEPRLTLRPREPARREIEVAGLNAVHTDFGNKIDRILGRITCGSQVKDSG